jgi:glycosyltransferase involved in cell wall biosynthesis
MGKVVLSYSTAQFNPLTTQSPVGGSGLIAQTFYREIQNSFPDKDVIYADCHENWKLAGIRNVDILIGISENIHKVSRALKPHRTILLAVNKPWIQRRFILNKAHKAGYPTKMLSPQDGFRSNSHELKVSDQVISLGNFANYQEYSELMGDSKLVFPISFNPYMPEMRSRRRKETILIFCGEISFRKGVDVVISLIPYIAEYNLKLKIVGNTNNEDLNDRLKQLESDYEGFFFHEKSWITIHSDSWNSLLDDAIFSIFPSREEGQASVLAELISQGIPTIYTEHAGLDWPLELSQPVNSDIDSWIAILNDFLRMNSEELDSVLRKQQEILKLLGRDSVQISKLVTRIAKGGLWPEISWDNQVLSNAPSTDSYIISQGAEFIDPIRIDFSSKSHSTSCNLEQDLIAIVDRYQCADKFRLTRFNETFQIQRVRPSPDPTVMELKGITLKVKASSELVSNAPKVLLLQSVGPWIYDRKFSRLYVFSYSIRDGFANFVGIFRALSKNNSSGNGRPTNHSDGK